ncbi:MAG TPA: hypothetical protein VEI07_09380, partial [Planctomycetaceae bacterium]|nr:hypothetical protein [Planctomycetaceae bacterium]
MAVGLVGTFSGDLAGGVSTTFGVGVGVDFSTAFVGAAGGFCAGILGAGGSDDNVRVAPPTAITRMTPDM